MKKTDSLTSPLSLAAAGDNDFNDEPLVTAEQAAKTLNLPMYYFTHTRKRKELGLPFYCVNRLIRFRLGELHQWQMDCANKAREERLAVLEAGGPDA